MCLLTQDVSEDTWESSRTSYRYGRFICGSYIAIDMHMNEDNQVTYNKSRSSNLSGTIVNHRTIQVLRCYGIFTQNSPAGAQPVVPYEEAINAAHNS